MAENKTILIIDDDQDFHTLVGGVLRKSGYVVKSIFQGSMKDILKSVKTCDMVLLDIELPMMDGVEVGKKLRSNPQTRYIPIIMISGHTDGEKLWKETSATDFIPKPFSLSGLLKKVTQYIG